MAGWHSLLLGESKRHAKCPNLPLCNEIRDKLSLSSELPSLQVKADMTFSRAVVGGGRQFETFYSNKTRWGGGDAAASFQYGSDGTGNKLAVDTVSHFLSH